LFTSEPQDVDIPSNSQRFNVERPKPVQQQQPQRNLPQQVQQKPRAQHFEDQRPHQHDDKPKKPVAQILRKYREEHPDGSIT